MMNRDRRLPDWLRFRSRPAAVVTALVTCLLLAPWVAEAQGNSAPTFTEGASATRSFNETIGDVAVETGSNIGAAVAAMDTDASDTLTYTLQGTDAARFGIISTSGQLRTRVGEKYDHESKSSYSVTVRVEDSSGGSDTITVTVNVTDQDEPPRAPRLGLIGVQGNSLYVNVYPPENTGRPAITKYNARYRANNEGEWIDVPRHSLAFQYYSDSRLDVIIQNLEPETLYYAQVRATNAEGDGAWSGSGYQETGAITSPTTYVRYGATSYTAFEGGADARVAVVLSRAPSEPVSFPIWKNAHLGGATEADYTGIPEYVTFNAGQRWSWFTVTATDDSVDDDGESVRLAFRTLPEGFRLDNPSRTTIVLDDADGLRNVEVRFDTHTHHTIEVREHIWPFRITLSLNQTPQRNLEIPLVVTEQGGATQEDYAGIPASVRFGPNETKTDFVMYAIPDQQQEVGEGLRIDFGTLPPGVRSLGHETIEFIEFDGNPWWYETEQWTEFWDTWSQTEHDDTDQATNNNSPNEGPGITGLPRAGEVLTATTSQIDDADGLVDARFTYQWERQVLATGAETDIPGATGVTYEVTSDDRDSAVRVSVSFRDAAENSETLSSYWLLVLTPPNNLATGAPTIGGAVRVGEELTADISSIADADGLTNVAYEYQWISSDGSSDVEITNATAPTYTVAAEDVGRTIRVRVTFTDDAGHQQTLTSEWTEAVEFAVQPQRANTPATGAPTISGTAQVGETLRAEISGIDDADGLVNASFTYQWERQVLATGAETDIPGATGATYEVTSDDRDRAVRVSVSFSDAAENGETLSSYWIPVLTPPNNLATGAPTIGGAAQVGGVLTADISSIADADGLTNVAYEYQWIAGNGRSDVEIANATASTYTVAAEDEGWTIRVRVTFTDDADHEESLTSAATALVQPPAPDGPPGVPDLPEAKAVFVGGVDLEWNEVPGAESYAVQLGRGGQWIDLPGGGVEVAFYGAGAIVSGLDPEASLWFRVRAANGHGVSDWSEVRYTGSTSQFKLGRKARRENAPASGAPVIHGTARVGESLWADASGIEDRNGLNRVQFRYQWTSNDGSADADIAGATESGYTLLADDEGKTIKVKVAFTDRGGYSETRTSAATEAVAARPNTPATGEPTIGGTAEVGETLTAYTTGIADADGLVNATYRYQWVANDGTTDTDISGATDASYTLVADDEGSTIKVRVIVTDDAGNETTLTSAATAAVGFAVQQQGASNTPATGQPTIRGTAQVGEVLTADTTGIADADGLTKATYRYQWVANDGTTDADISGATDNTYTLVADDAGKTIKVRVIVTDDLGNETTLTSTATDEVGFAVQQQTANTPATGEPTIIGTAQVGETLTADTSGIADADGLTNVSYSYQWIRNDGSTDTDITSATDSTYTLVDDDQGKTIKVRVIVTDDAGNETTLTSAATGAVEAAPRPDSPATGQPTIIGTARVGETLTADTTGIADADGLTTSTYGYQWVANDGGTDADISGETDASYTLVADDVGKTIKVRVIVTDDAGNETTLTSTATDEVGFAVQQQTTNTPATGEPTITGTAQVGQTLIVNITGIADADGLSGATFAYQWLSDDAEIGGATGSTYTLVAGDEGRTIKVRVIVTDDLGNETTLTSAATVEAAPQPDSPATGLPTISGTAQVGETLTANTSGIADADGLTTSTSTYSYQWLGDDTDIAGATSSTYTLVAGDEGQTIKVRVTVTDDAENKTTLTSAATEAVAAAPQPDSPATGEPTIIGTAQVGEVLTAGTTGIADADGLSGATFAYQWLADDVDISGATDATYTLVAGDEGQTIKVRVTVTDDAENKTTLTSAATEAVAAAPQPDSPATGEPTIIGTAQVGEMLTAETTGIADDDGLDSAVFAYQWLADDAEIGGATGSPTPWWPPTRAGPSRCGSS